MEDNHQNKKQKQKPKKQYKYPIDYWVTVTGKRGKKRVHITAKNRAEANQKLQDWMQRLNAPTKDAGRMTVRQWAEKWLESTVIPRELTPKSFAMYPLMLDRYILPQIGEMRLQDLTKADLQAVINKMGRHAKTYQHQCQIVIQQMIREAYDGELIERDISQGLKPSPTASDPKKRRPITPEERQALESVCYRDKLDDGKSNDSGAYFLTILYCGLRPGECAALRKEDVNFQTGYISVETAKERGSTTIKGPKTKAGIRQVPMDSDFAAWLQLWLEEHGTRPECPYVFAQRDRLTPMTDSVLQRKWETYKRYIDIALGAETEEIKPGRKHKTIIKKSKIDPDLVPYCLRHTYATELVSMGVEPWTLAYVMGHNDITVTNDYYVHIGKPQLEAARAKMNAYKQTHADVQMADVATWGLGPSRERIREETEKLQLKLRHAARPVRVAELNGGDTEQAAQQVTAKRREIAHEEARKRMGEAFDELAFRQAWQNIKIRMATGWNGYTPDAQTTHYLQAMTGDFTDLDTLTKEERQQHIKKLADLLLKI